MKFTKWGAIIGHRLEPGEVIEFGALARLGEGVSAKRQIATATIAAVASLGVVNAAAVKRPSALVLTNRRLLVFATGFNGDRPADRLVGSLTRGTFKLELGPGGVKRHYDLVAHDGSSVQLTFPIQAKKDADELARLVNLTSA